MENNNDMNKELNRKPWEYFNITEPLYNDIVAPYKEIAFQMAKEATGKFLLMDVNLIPNIKEGQEFDIDRFLELAKEQNITLVDTKPSLQEAVEVLCNALKDEVNNTEFYFEECKASNDCTHIYLLEAELEQKHKDLLLGEVLHKFNNLPLELKKNFLNLLIQK